MKVNALDYSHLSEPEMMFGRRGSPDNFFFFFFVVVLHSIVKINKNNQRYIHHAQKKHEWENVRRRSTSERRKCAKAKRKKEEIFSTYHEQEQQQHQQKQQALEAWSLCEGDELSGSCCWLEGIFEGVGCCRRDRLLSKMDEFSWFDWRVLIIYRRERQVHVTFLCSHFASFHFSHLRETSFLHCFKLTDKNFDKPKKNVDNWKSWHRIERWSG